MVTKESVSSRLSRVSRCLARFDAEYLARPGVGLLAGVDEAGRGALAGPVVAAAVVLDGSADFDGLNDSKQLTPKRREALYPLIFERARAVAVGWASAEEIDRINILQATHRAAGRALAALAARPDFILADALKLAGTPCGTEAVIKGDTKSQAIAAASVVAKVTRDRWMEMLDREYPEYGFAGHKGYGAPKHLAALREWGASTAHRRTFRGAECPGRDPRPSRTLTDLMAAAARGEIGPAQAGEIWLRRGYLLPEGEEALLEQAIRAAG